MSILAFLVVFWVFLVIFHILKRKHEMTFSISIRITNENGKIRPFGWIFTFWVKKLICILLFLLFLKITALSYHFFWWFHMIFKGSYHDFVLKCEKWLKIPKKNPKNDQKCKNQQKNYFNKKGFFHEGGLKPTFLLVILIDIL